MGNAGRLRIAIHGYNTHGNVEVLLQELKAVLKQLG
jgi:selenocysteine lyase/cysteine desulfurase